MLAIASCWLAAVLVAVPLASCKPADWTLHYSSQVARPVWVNARPESPVPRFPVPFASRRQDNANNLQSEVPVQVMPGDKVSLVVNGRNPLEPQQFVDVSSLLMELQKAPPASDGAYHVFLAPPNYPLVSGGQKFDVTYVGAPPRDPQQDEQQNNPHPALFVAPLDYSVPKGYGRIQVPTKNVKFALPPNFQQPQPAQFRPAPQPVAPPQPAPQRPVQPFQQSFQQPKQFQPVQQAFQQPQQFRQPQQFQPPQPAPAQFQPPQPAPAQFQPPQPAPVQFQPPQPAPVQFQPPQPAPVQFQPPQPAPVQFQQRPVQPAFQPVQQSEPFQQVQPIPQVKQPAPIPSLPVPMAFRPIHQQIVAQEAPALVEDSRVQPAPAQALEEIPAPDLTIRPREPVVLAAEKPEFLNDATTAVPDVTTEGPVATTEIRIAPIPQVEFKAETAFPVAAPVADPVSTEAALPVETTQAPATQAPTTQAPTTQAPATGEPTRPARKRPVAQVQTIDGAPQWPDFQTVRQRQQQNRQQINRQQINRQKPTGNAFSAPSPASFSREPSLDPAEYGEFSFGQKLRPKIKTNALVSPPVAPAPAPVAPAPVAPAPAPIAVAVDSLEADPPVIDRDEPFQTLESQNAASNRGRVRFSRPQEVNAVATAPTEAPARQTERTPVRNRFRITTTTTQATTTAAQTEAPPTRGDAQPEEQDEEDVVQQVKPTEETPAEEASEEVEDEKVEPVREEPKPWNPRLSLAAQRQRESAETTTAAPAKPNRGRGTITFANSRLTARPEQVARPVVIRPVAPRVRPGTPGSRIQRPVQSVVVREEEDFVAPVAPGFGVRDGAVINPAPQQSLLPVGRRVPESRPNPVQNIRIGLPRIQPTTERVVIVEEVPEEDFEPEVEDEEVVDEEEPENEQEEIVDEEVDENEEAVSNLAESTQVTSSPEAVEDVAVEESPVDEAPVEETPAEEAPAEEAPAEEAPAEEAPAEENPVETEKEPEVQEPAEEVGEEEPEKEAVVEEEVKEVQPEEPVESSSVPVTEAATTTTAIPTTTASSTLAPTTTEAATEEPEVVPTETTLAKPIDETPVELSVANNVDDDAADASLAESADERQVLGVSTATEVSLMYELCYRGRCVRVHE